MSTTKRSVSSRDRETEGLRDKAIREIEILNRQKLHEIDKNSAAKLASAVLDRIGRQDAELTITFIRDAAMRKLNREYRGKDKPTDVLSFAYHESDEGFAETDSHVGDVVISVETAARYAAEFGLTFQRELEHLIIHGTLHLAGYDHETDNGEMNRLERKLRKELLKK
ncbi:MAG: rRNA maturation RNase YbeY [Acidobacteriota bacterium]|nr:rRNA maturation RNase YbeY [Acidobacteriota bacterium]